MSRQKDKRIGRFGWKAQTPSLNDFVLTACAVELGLEVPGHHQGGLPQAPEAKATGLDLSAEECAALEAYVRNLPRPAERAPSGDSEARDIAAGKTLFAGSGCATCHTPKLGSVEGIYSDLLLHDMGPDLGDTGQYGVFDPNSSEPDFVDPDQPLAAETTTTETVVTAVTTEAPATMPVVVSEVRVIADSVVTGPGQVVAAPMAMMPAGWSWPRTPPGSPAGRRRAPRRGRNGGRLPCGASATRAPTCTTAGPPRWIRPSPCTAAKGRARPAAISCSRPRSDCSSRRS